MSQTEPTPALIFRLFFGLLVMTLLVTTIALTKWNTQFDASDPLYGLGMRFDTALTCHRSQEGQLRCTIADSYCTSYHSSKSIDREISELNVQGAKLIDSFYVTPSRKDYEQIARTIKLTLRTRAHGDLLHPLTRASPWYQIKLQTPSSEEFELFGTIYRSQGEKIVNKINSFVNHPDSSFLRISAFEEGALSSGLQNPTRIHPCLSKEP